MEMATLDKAPFDDILKKSQEEILSNEMKYFFANPIFKNWNKIEKRNIFLKTVNKQYVKN